jgi:hypothetical protein
MNISFKFYCKTIKELIHKLIGGGCVCIAGTFPARLMGKNSKASLNGVELLLTPPHAQFHTKVEFISLRHFSTGKNPYKVILSPSKVDYLVDDLS